MQRIKFLPFVSIIFTITMFSCNNNNSDPSPTAAPISSKHPTPQQARTYLSTRSWKLATLKLNGQDITEILDSTILDDVYTFRPDSSYTAYENPQSNTTDLTNGTWKFLDDYTIVIRYEGETEDNTYKVLSIDASTYVVEEEDGYQSTFVEIK
jgi:hypothetical protein